MKTLVSTIAALFLASCQFLPSYSVKPPVRPGCPEPQYDICYEDCFTDRDCPSNQQCCFSGCGNRCIGPKPGRCDRPVSSYVCQKLCKIDFDCPGTQKCCPHKCGYFCKEPISH